MKFIIPIFFFAIPAFAQDTATPITLSEAIRLSRANNPQTIQARGNERVNRAAVRSAIGSFLPSISLSAGTSRQYSNRVITQSFTLDASRQSTSTNGFSINAELFSGNKFPNLRAARAEVNAAKSAVISQDFLVATDVAQQYYNALSALESEQAARAQLEQAEQQMTASVRRVKAGAATRSDSLRAFVQVANARVALLTAQTNLRGANAALTRLIGSPTVVTAIPTDTSDVVSIALDSATIVGLALQGPSVDQAKAQLVAAKARQWAAKAAYLPSVDMSYSRSRSGSGGTFGLGTDAFNYGGQLSFSISYPLFNQFNREEQIVRAGVTRTNAEASLRDAELAAKQEAVQTFDALNTGLRKVEAQRIAVLAAEEDLRVQQARYDLGLSTIIDVLTSQTQLNQARANLIAARFEARMARARIEALIGRDLSSLSTSTQSTTR